jgi:hypothetical protein
MKKPKLTPLPETPPTDLNQFFEDSLEAAAPAEPLPCEPQVDAALNAPALLTEEETEALLADPEPAPEPPHVRPSYTEKAQEGDLVLRKGKKYLVTLRDGRLYVRRMGFSKLTLLWQDNCYRIWRPKNKEN